MDAIDPALPAVAAPPDMKKIPYPGKLNVASERGVHGHFSGCAIKLFPMSEYTEKRVSEWAEENPGNLVVDIKLGASYLAVFYTRAITDEEIAEFNEINREAARLINERRLAEQTLQAEQEIALAAKNKAAREKFDQEEKERNRLMELGRVHEAHCKKGKK